MKTKIILFFRSMKSIEFLTSPGTYVISAFKMNNWSNQIDDQYMSYVSEPAFIPDLKYTFLLFFLFYESCLNLCIHLSINGSTSAKAK